MKKFSSNFKKPTSIKQLANYLLAIVFLVVIFIYGSIYHKAQVEPETISSQNPTISNFTYVSEPEWLVLEKDLKARSLIVANLDAGEIYISRHPEVFVNIASLSKLMTAVVVIDNLDLNKIIKVSQKAINTYGNGDNLKLGERLSANNLLKDLLVFSSNDAAVALAEGVGYNKFIGLMNQKAKQIGLKETAFFDATGLDEKGNFSNAGDLLKLVNYIYKNYPLIGSISRMPSVTFQSVDGIYTHNLSNTDQLIGKIDNLWLSKTGTTDNAGECLILVYRLENGQAIASIILGSTDRFGDTLSIYNWFKKEEKVVQ